MAAKNEAMPLPSSRGRAVSADAARSRGGALDGPSTPTSLPSAPATTLVADTVAADPALEQLRSRKVRRTGLNVHINSSVHKEFAAFVDTYDLPKGDAVSLAIQEFLERRGVVIPGVARVLPLPSAATNHDQSRVTEHE